MLFRRTKNKLQSRGLSTLSLIAQNTHILGTLVSDGHIDFDGSLDGNIRCHALTVRKNGRIKGDVTVDILHIYGKVDGVIQSKNVHLHADCRVDGIIMHENLIIEEGAFMDGKCKRIDKVEEIEVSNNDSSAVIKLSDNVSSANNIRLFN